MMSSDAGETTSTDSDIGTSPSGLTLASPPSSPQQPAQSPNKLSYNTFYFNNPASFKSNTNETSKPGSLNYSVIRQHSYLNAVQLNDFKLNQFLQSNNFLPIGEQDLDF